MSLLPSASGAPSRRDRVSCGSDILVKDPSEGLTRPWRGRTLMIVPASMSPPPLGDSLHPALTPGAPGLGVVFPTLVRPSRPSARSARRRAGPGGAGMSSAGSGQVRSGQVRSRSVLRRSLERHRRLRGSAYWPMAERAGRDKTGRAELRGIESPAGEGQETGRPEGSALTCGPFLLSASGHDPPPQVARPDRAGGRVLHQLMVRHGADPGRLGLRQRRTPLG